MKIVNIFLGGGINLLEGESGQNSGYRKSVVDQQVSSLNSQVDAYGRLFIIKTYHDLTHEVVAGGQQKCYNKYVRDKADIAIFILDGSIGDKTSEELENALTTFENKGRPLIFVYGINLTDEDSVVESLNSRHLYYQHFCSKNDLAAKLRHDLLSTDCSKSKVRQRKRNNQKEKFTNRITETSNKKFRSLSIKYPISIESGLSYLAFYVITWITPIVLGLLLYFGKVKSEVLCGQFKYKNIPFHRLNVFLSRLESGSFFLFVLLTILAIWGYILIKSSNSFKGKITTFLFELISFILIVYVSWNIFIV